MPAPERCADEIAAILESEAIVFRPGSAEIDPVSGGVIAATADVLRECPGAAFEVAGHTDSSGEAEANQRLSDDQRVTSLIVLGDGQILTVSEHGYGKVTEMDDYPRHGRAGQGVIALQTSGRNGVLVGARQVRRDDEVMLINSSGTLVRVPVSDIPVLGRNTQGVRIMRLEEGEKLVGLERIAGDDSQDGEGTG
jgi:DNA gyrase/topoisomerase IV subunit A